MNNTIAVESLEQLKQFLNDNNVLEIVTREKNKRIKTFQKVVLNNLPKTEASEMVVKLSILVGNISSNGQTYAAASINEA